MVTFLRALLQGEVFKDPATLAFDAAAMESLRLSTRPSRPSSSGWPIQYALGLMRFRLPRVLTPLRSTPAWWATQGPRVVGCSIALKRISCLRGVWTRQRLVLSRFGWCRGFSTSFGKSSTRGSRSVDRGPTVFTLKACRPRTRAGAPSRITTMSSAPEAWRGLN